MLGFILKNAPNIREFHAWDTASIQVKPSFLQKFDARALEHCTLLGMDQLRVYGDPSKSSETRFLPFFNGGGARLRSLCLTGPRVLPANAFPALTLLLIASGRPRTTMEDLITFLAGCPRLEEAYIYNIQRNPFHAHTLPSPPILLPRLKYLYYTCDRRYQDSEWEEDADPIEYLLSRTSIPSTCHLYLTVKGAREQPAVTNRRILTSVCRHVQEKDTVSRVFLWLTNSPPTHMQLVFSQGSLRLHYGYQFHFVDALPPLAPFFSKTKDVRVRYGDKCGYTPIVHSLATTLPTTFPSIEVLSLIRQNPDLWANTTRSESVEALHQYLGARVPQPSEPLSISNSEADRIPWHPRLDTLWVSVESKEEIASLRETLADRTALGFPIRCVIVHHCFEARSKALALLRALEDDAEEVILMEISASSFRFLGEGDWVQRLPDRFSLPAALRRDWPTRWYQTKED